MGKEQENQKMVTITEKEYNNLLGDSARISYLEGAGVDNWSGYEYAQEEWENDGMEELYGNL